MLRKVSKVWYSHMSVVDHLPVPCAWHQLYTAVDKTGISSGQKNVTAYSRVYDNDAAAATVLHIFTPKSCV